MKETDEIHTKGKVLKCPNCGASEAEFDIDAGGLRCLVCREVFMSPKVNEYGGFEELVGEVRESGAKDLRNDDYAGTFKCPACGANVMFDKNVKEVRCHWCRHNLTVAEKIPNGEMPDLVLPFSMKRRSAFLAMKSFVDDKRIFALGRFHRGLKEKNLRAVYLPYILVDVKARVKAYGIGTVVDKGTPRNLKVYREFEMLIDDLTVEASRDKLNRDKTINTNYVINAILPFDTSEAVAWDPRYLKGYSCEKRDINIEGLKVRLDYQVADIAKNQIYKMIDSASYSHLNVGEVEYVGRRWKTAYFPVWLYSCREFGFGKWRKIHYIAVNARTGETMGSVPVGKLFWNLVMFGPLAISVILTGLSPITGMNPQSGLGLIIASLIIYVAVSIFANNRTEDYKNNDARHDYENETRVTINEAKSDDCLSEKTIAPMEAKIVMKDEKGETFDIYPSSKFMQDVEEKPTFIEPEKFFMGCIMVITVGLILLVVGLIMASEFGLL